MGINTLSCLVILEVDMFSSCEMAISTLDIKVSLDSSSDLLITSRSLKLNI